MKTAEKENYQKTLDSILKEISTAEKKPTLLLHACCAPCSSYVIEYLSSYFNITIYYYNPNIYPEAEYLRRLSELESFLSRFKPSVENHINLIKDSYNIEDYFQATKANESFELQQEKERGERCNRCYRFRMERAYRYASLYDFDWFTTTLSISPFKDVEKINIIGRNLQQDTGPKFLVGNFKKRNGFLRSLQISAEYNLYRQEYCGCLYSYKNMH